ncbi:hypothetical protein MMC07_003204 [Pseudocyphellaria aurata]|nr:hypothetical protein [Pseudocyphellaria aurata]
MTFNPVDAWAPSNPKEEPNQACEVSRAKRIAQVAVAVIYCLCSAGVVFGYAAIKPVLVKEGVYSNYCQPQHVASRGQTCYEQEIRLNFMFAAAAVATNVCALPVGTVLDRYGPRLSSIVGSISLAIGAVLLAYAAQLPFDGYLSGYLFLALGGPFVFIPSFQLSNTFQNHSGLILALLTGAFDSSSAIFLFYRLIYTASNGTFDLQKFFLAYLVVPVFVFIAQIFLMPSKSYKTVGELTTYAEASSHGEEQAEWCNGDDERGNHAPENQRSSRESEDSEITSLLGHKGAGKQQRQEERKKAISGVWGALHGRSALQQIRTPWFVLVTLFTIFQMTRINYFVATVRTQYDYLLDDGNLAKNINHVFDVALPVGGVLSVPFIGLVLDNVSTPAVLALLVVIATTIGILGVLPYIWAAYANIAFFVIYRPLYYTALSDYAAKVFGFQTFGKVYGLMICLAGVLNFLQSALDAATHKIFGGDPVPVNVIMLAIVLVVGSALVGYVWQKSQFLARTELEHEAEVAAETSMPSTYGSR